MSQTLKKAAYDIEPPKQYPGNLHQKNQSGTVLNKNDWIVKQAENWRAAMKVHPVYDQTSQSD